MVTDGVVVKPPQVGERTLLQVPALGAHLPAVIEPPNQIGEGAAGVGKAYFEPLEAIEHATEDQLGGGDRRIEWIAEQVGKEIRPQSLRADDLEWMQKNRQAKILEPFVDREKHRIREFPIENPRRQVDSLDAA